ncbi:MAG: DNA polymerase III subunit delta [Planctomycetota bacterium]|jgi:DNA polymerase-3 subunit delta
MSASPGQLDSLDASMRIVVLHGKETYLIDEGTKRLAAALEAEHGKDTLQRIIVDGETVELADVLDELRTFGLFQNHKLVIVDKADKFLAPPRTDDEQEQPKTAAPRRRALEAYAENPCPGTTLLMRADSWRPGKLDKLVGAVIKCEPVKDEKAVAWCVVAAPKRHGRAIAPEAARLLVDRLGAGLSRLDTELGKLAAFVGDDRAIGPDDVRVLVGQSREEHAWELQTAIVSGRPGEACRTVRELMEISRVDATLVMWAITDLLRRLHTIAQMFRRGDRPHARQRELRLWGPTGDRILDLAQRGEPKVFARMLDHAVATDLRTKSGIGRAGRNLEALTLQVTDTIGCL